MNKWTIRNKIIKRLHKMRDDLEQSIRNIEWWNANVADEETIDLGFEKTMRHCVNGQIDAWEHDDIEAVNRWQDRMNCVASAVIDNVPVFVVNVGNVVQRANGSKYVAKSQHDLPDGCEIIVES